MTNSLGSSIPRPDDTPAALTVVLGAAGDIGSATAARLAVPGATLLLGDLNTAALDSVVASLARSDVRVQCASVDMSDEPSVEAFTKVANELGHGAVRRIVNAVGVAGPAAPVTKFPTDAFDHIMSVNVRSVFLAHKYLGRLMQAGSAVVNLSSVGGLRGQAAMSAYVASKHAVLGLTRVAALEWAPRGIRVNAVCPGPIEGQMMSSIFQHLGMESVQAEGTVPLGRLGVPRDVAETIAFLLSDAAAHITGTYLTVDGGRLARY